VLCVDEKPQIQAAQGTAPAFPLRPGQAERRTHGYRRYGTLDLFAALDVRAGTVIGAREWRHRSVEFRAFRVKQSVPPGIEVHLVLATRRRTGPSWSTTGCSSGRASTCTSLSPACPGSTWSSAGSRS
jgi:hypothetical protein